MVVSSGEPNVAGSEQLKSHLLGYEHFECNTPFSLNPTEQTPFTAPQPRPLGHLKAQRWGLQSQGYGLHTKFQTDA